VADLSEQPYCPQTRDDEISHPREYPPLSDKAYNYSIYGIKIPTIVKPTQDGYALIKAQFGNQDKAESVATTDAEALSEETENNNMSTLGETLARNIDWNQSYYNGGEMGISRRSSFVDAVNLAVMKGTSCQMFEFCNKCQIRHIVKGAPLTLDERDTCHSLLPEWFKNADEFAEVASQPWLYMREYVNTIVKMNEIQQGLYRDPTKKVWNKNYHEADPLREPAERRGGGWWECRRGSTDYFTQQIPESELKYVFQVVSPLTKET
jgi:hypothetical protein